MKKYVVYKFPNVLREDSNNDLYVWNTSAKIKPELIGVCEETSLAAAAEEIMQIVKADMTETYTDKDPVILGPEQDTYTISLMLGNGHGYGYEMLASACTATGIQVICFGITEQEI